MAEATTERRAVPDIFLCQHLEGRNVRSRVAAAYEAHLLTEQGMTVAEIAKLLGVHTSTVRYRLDNWRVYLLWADQAGPCAQRVRSLVNEVKKG